MNVIKLLGWMLAVLAMISGTHVRMMGICAPTLVVLLAVMLAVVAFMIVGIVCRAYPVTAERKGLIELS
jgi:hypothetical protein